MTLVVVPFRTSRLMRKPFKPSGTTAGDKETSIAFEPFSVFGVLFIPFLLSL